MILSYCSLYRAILIFCCAYITDVVYKMVYVQSVFSIKELCWIWSLASHIYRNKRKQCFYILILVCSISQRSFCARTVNGGKNKVLPKNLFLLHLFMKNYAKNSMTPYLHVLTKSTYAILLYGSSHKTRKNVARFFLAGKKNIIFRHHNFKNKCNTIILFRHYSFA